MKFEHEKLMKKEMNGVALQSFLLGFVIGVALTAHVIYWVSQ